MLEWFRAKSAAKRMNIRDRGKIQKFIDNNIIHTQVCSQCNTRLRIGIQEENHKKTAIVYCWRCEEFIKDGEEEELSDGKDNK